MQTNQNVGKTTQNPKTAPIGHNSKIVTLSVPKKMTAKHLKELNLKQGKALLNENRDGLIEFSASVVHGEAKQESLIERFFKAGFKAIMLTSPNDKKEGSKKDGKQKTIKSKNVYLTVKQWEDLHADFVKTFTEEVQTALRLPAEARTEYQNFLNDKWKRKSSSIVSTIARGLQLKEDKAKALADAEEREAKGLKPLKKASKKPSRNRTPQQVFYDNINQCVKLVQEHESELKIAQPNDLIANLRLMITKFDKKSF
tara:strand:- start:128 stop:895 length:768 start_codon:yes stop_codon:yes gene_type:complete